MVPSCDDVGGLNQEQGRDLIKVNAEGLAIEYRPPPAFSRRLRTARHRGFAARLRPMDCKGDSLGDILSNRSRGILPRKFNALWPNPECEMETGRVPEARSIAAIPVAWTFMSEILTMRRT